MDKETFDKAVRWAKLVQQLSPSYGTLSRFAHGRALTRLAQKDGTVDELMRRLVETSRTEAWAWDILNVMLIHRIRTNSCSDLPFEVRYWAGHRLADVNRRPRKGRIRRPWENLAIVDAVYAVKAHFNLFATRGRSEFPESCAEGGSACDVVGQAQTPSKNYKATEAIWREWGFFATERWSEGPWEQILEEWLGDPKTIYGEQRRIGQARILTELEF